MKSNSNSASIGTNDLAEVSNLFRRLAVSKVKKRLNQNLPGSVQKLLREWLLENQECPFPGKVAQRVLALENKVEVDKIQNWFMVNRLKLLSKGSSPPVRSLSAKERKDRANQIKAK